MKKIFFIGFHKTGTTTISKVFELLGMKTVHHWRNWIDGSNRKVLEENNVFADGCLHDFRKLHELYPDAHFFLNVRPLEPWIFSKLRHIDELRDRRPHLLPGDTDDCGGMDPNWYGEGTMERWVEGRRAYHREAFRYFSEVGRPLNVFQIADLSREEVIESFRELFSEIGVNDELGGSVLEKIPHSNRNEFQRTRRQQYLWNQYLDSLGDRQLEPMGLDIQFAE